MALRQRIKRNYKEGNGDCPVESELKSKLFDNKYYPFIFSQADYLQSLLQEVIVENYLSDRENKILLETVNSLSDIMAFLSTGKYEISHLEEFTNFLENEICFLKRNSSDCREFVRFLGYPGVKLNIIRCLVRSLEQYIIIVSSNPIICSFSNRLSSYLWWLSWFYHFDRDDELVFWTKASVQTLEFAHEFPIPASARIGT